MLVASIYVCFAFLSAISVQPACACESEANSTRELTRTPETNATLEITEAPFPEKLRNPCSLNNPSSLQSGSLSQEEIPSSKRNAVVSRLKLQTLKSKNSSEYIKTIIHEDCSNHEMPSVFDIPSANEISNKHSYEVLRLFYPSLLHHTARIYFILEQLRSYSSDSTCHNEGLSTSAKSLASDMRQLICDLRVSTLVLEQKSDKKDPFNDATDLILNEQFEDQPICSKRLLRDCQTIRSTETLLEQLSNYLQNNVIIDASESLIVSRSGLLNGHCSIIV